MHLPRFNPTTSLILLMACISMGCTEDPRKDIPAPPGAGEALTSPTQPTADVGTEAYDPYADPLVNPQVLFASAKAQRDEVNDDATVYRLLEGNPTTLTPIFRSSRYEVQCAYLLFDGLILYDAELNWMPNPNMVESIEEAEDHLSHTVVLKPGLRWHDGHPLTAQDIRFSWEAILDDDVPCPAMKVGTDQIEDVEIVDDRTVIFHHREALPTNKDNIGFDIIPAHIYGDTEERAQDPTLTNSDYYTYYGHENVIGNGPYRFVEWIKNDRIVMERWEDYPGEKPPFKRVVLKIQPDSNTALLLFKRGEVDEMRLSAPQFALETGPETDFAEVGYKAFAPEWSFAYIGWNMDGSNPFFEDKKVRVAMGHAFDYDRIIRTIGYNLYSRCYGIYHPDSWMFNDGIDLMEYDLERAGQLLDEAGWHLSEVDGWRYKEVAGRAPVQFSFELLIPQGSDAGQQIAAIFAEDLRKIGVEMTTRVVEWATFMQMTRRHEFQAMTAGWGTGSDPDSGWNLWRSDQYDKGRNYGGYYNLRVDELFELGRQSFDRTQRAEIYGEIQKIIYEDQPYLFIWNRSTLWAFTQRMRGVGFSPFGVTLYHPGERAWWTPQPPLQNP